MMVSGASKAAFVMLVGVAPMLLTQARSSDADKLAALQRTVDKLAQSSLSPIGSVVAYAGAIGDLPADGSWLPCNGRALSSDNYRDLFAKIGTIYGDGRNRDGSKVPNTNFNLPDYRGAFLRGQDPDKRFDARADDRLPVKLGTLTFGPGGNTVGSFQSDSMQTHGHTEQTAGHRHPGTTAEAGSHSHTATLPTSALFLQLHPSDRVAGGGLTRRTDPLEGNPSIRVSESGSHIHSFTTGANDLVKTGPPDDSAQSSSGNAVRSGDETRPVNYAVRWLIRVL
jgi:microcystin-dependent protein